MSKISVLSMGVMFLAFHMQAQSTSHQGPTGLKWKTISTKGTFERRVNFLNDFLTQARVGEAGLAIWKDSIKTLVVRLDFSKENVRGIKGLADLPDYLFKDSLRLTAVWFNNYIGAAGKISKTIFNDVIKDNVEFNHIVCFIRANNKEKYFFATFKFENKVVPTYANFCTNDYREIEWEESRFIYQSRFADSLYNPKKKYWTVPDRATIVSFLLSPLPQISVDYPTGNQKGNIYYRFRWDDYKKYDTGEVQKFLYRVSSVMIPFTFKDSTKRYKYFVMEPVNDVDSTLAVWTSKIPKRIKKHRMSLEKFLETFTLFLPFEKIDHSIINIKKTKVLYLNLFTGNNPFWKYQYEKPYFQYLCFYLYDTMRKQIKKQKVDMILARFTHSDGRVDEFSFDLSNPIFKEMYGYPFFFPIKRG